ncbi:MAG TPA: SDR family NAD(P)-dependent oxidoreductase [Candidatus Aquilonibacter sp.]|nr:SDR family NAD(P)-dependent oxidoreductase [Candidatus Aquilonibacter sp.]
MTNGHAGDAELERERSQQKNPLSGKLALVTGASSGIGRAVAIALSREGARVVAVARDSARLAETVKAAGRFSSAVALQADLTAAHAIPALFEHLQREGRRLDILLHSAGLLHQALMEHARIEDFDAQYAVNVRAPYALTKTLLPMMTSPGGQIIFVNSSAGLAAKRSNIGQYGATKHALKAVADSLREEVNPKGIKVVTLYLGRTATPMQEALYQTEGTDYHPGTLIQPEDVASAIVYTLMLSDTVEVTDISMRPMKKSY